MRIMVNRKHLLSYLFCVTGLLLFSCKSKLESKDAVQQYLLDPKNGLQVTEISGKVQVKLTYQPSELIAERFKKQPDVYKDYAGKYFFILGFSANGKELLRQLDYNIYSEMVQVFAFRMPGFISIIPDKNEAVPPEDCLFNQTYGMADANNLFLVFDRDKLKDARQLTLQLKEFGLGLGNLSFLIDTKDIQNIPTITLK